MLVVAREAEASELGCAAAVEEGRGSGGVRLPVSGIQTVSAKTVYYAKVQFCPSTCSTHANGVGDIPPGTHVPRGTSDCGPFDLTE